MKTNIVKSYMLLLSATDANNPLSYLIGGIVALLILGYLVYTLMRPERF
jgi:K+-transporting ATPase KdpF subunit